MKYVATHDGTSYMNMNLCLWVKVTVDITVIQPVYNVTRFSDLATKQRHVVGLRLWKRHIIKGNVNNFSFLNKIQFNKRQWKHYHFRPQGSPRSTQSGSCGCLKNITYCSDDYCTPVLNDDCCCPSVWPWCPSENWVPISYCCLSYKVWLTGSTRAHQHMPKLA